MCKVRLPRSLHHSTHGLTDGAGLVLLRRWDRRLDLGGYWNYLSPSSNWTRDGHR